MNEQPRGHDRSEDAGPAEKAGIVDPQDALLHEMEPDDEAGGHRRDEPVTARIVDPADDIYD